MLGEGGSPDKENAGNLEIFAKTQGSLYAYILNCLILSQVNVKDTAIFATKFANFILLHFSYPHLLMQEFECFPSIDT